MRGVTGAEFQVAIKTSPLVGTREVGECVKIPGMKIFWSFGGGIAKGAKRKGRIKRL